MESAAKNAPAATSATATGSERASAEAGPSRAAEEVVTPSFHVLQEQKEIHPADREGQLEKGAGEDNSTPAEATTDAPTLSKKQQKRALKRARWEEGKHERRQQEREKKRQRKKEKKAQLHEDIANGIVQPRPKSLPRTPVPIDVVVDLGFDELMVDKVRSRSSRPERPQAQLLLTGTSIDLLTAKPSLQCPA